MVLDSSALVALIMAEAPAQAVFDRIMAAPIRSVGAPTLLETAMVLEGRRTAFAVGPASSAASDLELVLSRLEITIEAFGADHWTAALSAFRRYGKGRHAARLNFGDCMTYAVAKLSGQPLLCVGDDFAQTDLELVPLTG